MDNKKIVSYLQKVLSEKGLEELYQWSKVDIALKTLEDFNVEVIKNEPNDYAKTIKLKNIVGQKLKQELNEGNLLPKICIWIVKDWGGIRSGNEEKFKDLIKPFHIPSHPIENLTFDRIASTSKIAAFKDPMKYAIFDSRVALAINWIIYNKEVGDEFFPIPPKRSFSKNQQELKEKLKGKKVIPKGEVYSKYLNLIREISEEIWVKEDENKLQKTEMLLFSLGGTTLFQEMASNKL